MGEKELRSEAAWLREKLKEANKQQAARVAELDAVRQVLAGALFGDAHLADGKSALDLARDAARNHLLARLREARL